MKLRRLIPRFSWRTLILFTLLCTSGFGLWWRWEPWVCVAILEGHEGRAWAGGFSPDGSALITVGPEDHSTIVRDAHDGTFIRPIDGMAWAGFSPDGHALVVIPNKESFFPGGVIPGLADYSHDVVYLVSGELGPRLDMSKRAVTPFSYSPDGSKVLTTACFDTPASETSKAEIWSMRTGELLMELKGHDARVIRGEFSPDGKTVVTAGGKDKTARVWNAVTGSVLHVLRGHTEQVAFASFSPDGRRILSGGNDKTVRIWDALSGQEVCVLRGHSVWIGQASWSPNGTRVLTAAWDKTARLWDPETGEQLAVAVGHKIGVEQAHFSPDGSRIMSVGEEALVRIWDADDCRPLAVLLCQPGDSINNAAWSPDGNAISTYSHLGLPRLFRRRRPEWWWGVFYLKEFWATAACAALLLWSVLRDRRSLAARPSAES